MLYNLAKMGSAPTHCAFVTGGWEKVGLHLPSPALQGILASVLFALQAKSLLRTGTPVCAILKITVWENFCGSKGIF